MKGTWLVWWEKLARLGYAIIITDSAEPYSSDFAEMRPSHTGFGHRVHHMPFPTRSPVISRDCRKADHAESPVEDGQRTLLGFFVRMANVQRMLEHESYGPTEAG